MQSSAKSRELTLASLIGGVLVGAVLNVGIVFAGMQIGFTIVGSAVGAILGFGLLRGILRKGTILEVNIFQTIASSVNTVNSGVIFTVPVVFLLGRQQEIHYPALILAAIGGSVLGVVMIIPLRKQIIDFERLRFPTAVGVASILKSPGAGKRKAALLVLAIALAMLVSGLTLDWTGKGKSLVPSEFAIGEMLHLPAGLRLVFATSLLSLGAGFIAGRPGLVVLYGTLLNYWFLVPAAVMLGWLPSGVEAFDPWSNSKEAHELANSFIGAFSKGTSRLVGVGMILGGALAGVLVALPALRSAFQSLRQSGVAGERQEELSMRTLATGAGLGAVALFVGTWIAGDGQVSVLRILFAAFVGAVWLWLAGLIVAQTTGRTDWSPLSGLALIAVAISMAILGNDEHSLLPAVTIGAAICVATSMCADMMADLKTGYLVGGIPRLQQIAQLATCWIGPGIAIATVIVLWKAYAFGPDQAALLHARAVEAGPIAVAAYVEAGGSETDLPEGTPALGAPQAGALKGAIEVIQKGDVPVGKYLTGAALGILVSVLVSPGLGVMVGLSMYLPFEYMIVFGIGGLLSILFTRWKGARFCENYGVPVAAGFIVGDALIGVANAIVRVYGAI